jgi:hypothetical protein
VKSHSAGRFVELYRPLRSRRAEYRSNPASILRGELANGKAKQQRRVHLKTSKNGGGKIKESNKRVIE